jgi:eukaryotic-like serine/threonine-protein kinase
MALNAGTRIGAFEITGHLGSGGMGEVYRARDTTIYAAVAEINSDIVLLDGLI